MKKWRKLTPTSLVWLAVVVAGGWLLLLFLFLAPTNSRDNANPAKQTEMVELTLEWGRLAPFPKGVKDFSIRTEGGIFTRSFRASFGASKDEIEQWITASPGLVDATVESAPDGKQRYIISPGGGASYAEVVIDFKSNKVEVYVSWS